MAMSTGKVVALIQAMGGADPAVIEAKVQDWLDAHPEATTTVQDGSITEQKLATSIAQKLGLISSLSDEIVVDLIPYSIGKMNYYSLNTGAPQSSDNWISFIFDVDSIKKIVSVTSISNTAQFLQVAFYTAFPFDTNTFVSGLQFGSTSAETKTDIQIPASTKYCIISNRVASDFTPVIKGVAKKNAVSGHQINIHYKQILNTGALYTANVSWVTDLIPVASGKNKIASKYPINKIAFYDSNGDAISVVDSASAKEINIIETAAFVRLQYLYATSDFFDNSNCIAFVTGIGDATPSIVFGTPALFMAYFAYSNLYSASGVEYSGERINLKNTCEVVKLSYTANGQDACQHNGILFAFSETNGCKVVNTETGATIATFEPDQYAQIKPHCNSAVFSNAYFSETDLFPVIYINAYNSPGLPNGTCYVHRILTDSNGVPTGTTLLQTITVGFANTEPWTDGNDIRPYGNFFVDTDNGFLYAYTLKDTANVTRFFKFALPSLENATVTLTNSDILEQFDVPYMEIIQGNTFKGGKAYIVSGYNTGYLNVVNLYAKQLVTKVNLNSIGMSGEPEFINIANGQIIAGSLIAYAINFS